MEGPELDRTKGILSNLFLMINYIIYVGAKMCSELGAMGRGFGIRMNLFC